MGKLPFGVPNKHVMVSQGADSDIMKFYSSQYATTYGKKWSKFQPRTGRHTGTGYLSNFRPGVYYSARLDEIDNPTMGHIVADNYHSVTQKHFQPYKGPDGTEPLPNSLKQVGSGFIRQKPLSIPTQSEVRSVHIDTRVASAPADIMPRHISLLNSKNAKEPVELENGGYGPKYMSTETHQRFKGQQPDRSDVSRRSVGGKEGSGFTHAYNVEPVTYHPGYAYQGDIPGYYTDRPTGTTIMKTHYRPTAFPKGDEPLPKLADRASRETGFTSGTRAKPGFVNRVPSDAYDKALDMPPAKLERTKKQDPAEYLNMVHPNNHTSIATDTFLGKQQPNKSESDRMGRTAVGTKELTGYCENNDHYINSSDNPARFITHYQTKFWDRTSKNVDREGHTWGGVQPQKEDGFTKSTNVHSHGTEMNTTATIRGLEPYVSRSIIARDKFFDDHTHDAKLSRFNTFVAA